MRWLGRPWVVAAARGFNAAFFVTTSIYCLLAYTPFTYEQFIRPQVSAALSAFAVWHPFVHLLALCVTALTLAPFLAAPGARFPGWSYLAAASLLGGWFFVHPLWRQEGTAVSNLVLAFVAAIPPLWLGLADHAATRHIPSGDTLSEAGAGRTSEARLWAACWTTAAFVFVVYAAVAPLRLATTGGVSLTVPALLLAWAVSALGHLTVFTALFLVLSASAAAVAMRHAPGRSTAGREYWALGCVAALAGTMVLLRFVLAPIAIRGPVAWAVAAATAASLTIAWSGIARHHRKPHMPPLPALDAWLTPIVGRGRRVVCLGGLVAAPIAAHAAVARVATFDWEFMLQKLVALTLWLVAFAFVHALLGVRRPDRPRWMAPAVVVASFAAGQVALARMPAGSAGATLSPEFALDGYAGVDPSFRVARDLLGTTAGPDAAAFYTYLREHSAIGEPSLTPVAIDFDRGSAPGRAARPHVFLFVLDSLRRDYLSVYNPAVTFTPAIEAFAGDSFVFTRAFSRYAGTGLSVPAMWAGAMLIHRQYVLPFAPTNALEKLVAAGGYRRLIAEDHLTDALFPADPRVGLDRGVPEMLHTFCGTAGQLERQIEPAAATGAPLFVMTRPLDLHIGNIASATVPPGESYPGFHAPYAARVARIDACFGELMATLERLGLYDDSIIVVTSDHGDSLGEGQRWGHGFTAFPEVLRIPLIIRVPSRLRPEVSADLGRVSFSTDVTPTLYALIEGGPGTPLWPAGAEPGVRELLVGAPLIVRPSERLADRRAAGFLVASSYGPVYGLISRNGRRLYLADGVESREYAYALGPDGADVRIGMSDAEREAARAEIRRQIAELARWSGYDPAR